MVRGARVAVGATGGAAAGLEVTAVAAAATNANAPRPLEGGVFVWSAHSRPLAAFSSGVSWTRSWWSSASAFEV